MYYPLHEQEDIHDDLDIWDNHDERLENDEISGAEQGFMHGFLNDELGDFNAL